MADSTHIEWTDATWNPITGCSVVSPGCTNCYAMKLAGTRLQHHPSRKGLTAPSKAGPVWTGEVRFNHEWLDQPLRWQRPRRIFVCAHGDLFHESVPDAWIDQVFAVMALAPQHTFQVLTKRSARMRAYLTAEGVEKRIIHEAFRIDCEAGAWMSADLEIAGVHPLPLPNVWLGVSAEDQPRADERIPDLLATPAAVRFVSLEPLLGPIDLEAAWHGESALSVECWGDCGWCASGYPPLHNCRKHEPPLVDVEKGRSGLDWVIVGGESGDRPMHPDWVRTLRDQCAHAEVPFFFKQWGTNLPWEPLDEGVCWKSQAGEVRDRHALGDVDDPKSGWSDECLYDGDDICVHQHVGKKAAGRLLDGVEHNAMPAHG